MESKKVLAVLEDLFFTVKINESAKRAGLRITFVKSEHDVLEQAKHHPALIIMDMNFQGIDPLKPDPQAQGGRAHQAHQPDRVSFARPGRAKAAGPGSGLRYGAGALGVFAEPAPDPQAPLRFSRPLHHCRGSDRRTRSTSAVNCRAILSATSALAPAKLRSIAFLRGRPDHVAVLVHQPDRSQRLVLALMDIGGVFVAHAHADASAPRR